jgi:hypothetical protein
MSHVSCIDISVDVSVADSRTTPKVSHKRHQGGYLDLRVYEGIIILMEGTKTTCLLSLSSFALLFPVEDEIAGHSSCVPIVVIQYYLSFLTRLLYTLLHLQSGELS